MRDHASTDSNAQKEGTALDDVCIEHLRKAGKLMRAKSETICGMVEVLFTANIRSF